MSLDVSLSATRPTMVFHYNITHNLGRMADAAGLYEALWTPKSIDVKTAKELTPFLEQGLEKLKANESFFREFDSPNGWGRYVYCTPGPRRRAEDFGG